MEQVELTINVSDAAALGEPARIAATVHLPLPATMPSPPIVCFAKPGAGFSRHYFTTDLPGPVGGNQAQWHAKKGWVFISVDHLGVGESSCDHDPSRLTFDVVSNASLAAEKEILERLVAGTLSDNFPPVVDPVCLGIGQSMGGCLTVIQQGRHHCYDGIAVLGFSAVQTQPPSPPGHPKIVTAWRVPRGMNDTSTAILNEKAFNQMFRDFHGREPGATDIVANSAPEASLWHYYHDDVIDHLPSPNQQPAPWTSKTIPGLIACVLTPGIIAPEAAAVETPVLIAAGERDVIADIHAEPKAYRSSRCVDLFVCPRMGHMHNFAGTREQFWQQIDNWAQKVVNQRG